jgi:heptosyltransferase II
MRKILIITPNWIGDCLMAQPLFRRLKEKLGQVALHAFAPPWVAPVLKRMPELDEVISTPFVHGPLQLKQRWRLGRSLRGLGYAQAIVLPNTWKSALLPFFADIALRAGYVGESRYGLLNLTYQLDKRNPPAMAARYAALADAPGKPVSAAWGSAAANEPHPANAARLLTDLRPSLRANQGEIAATLSQFSLENAHSMGIFAPGAEYGPAKRWPVSHFAELATRARERGTQVLLLGSAKDRAIGEAIVQQSAGAARNLCGETTLDQAMDLIAAAHWAVCNDSGLMHIAAAFDKPQVALFGSSSATHTPPLSSFARIAEIPVAQLPCRPCFARVCPLGHFKCMNDLLPARVDETLQTLLL